MIYSIVLLSPTYQHESTVYTHMFPVSWSSLPPPIQSCTSRLSQSTGFELPVSYNIFPLYIYFTYSNVYVSVWFFQFVSPSSSPMMSSSLLSMSASPLLSCKLAHQYHLSKFQMYVLIYLFFIFWLTSLYIIDSRFIHFSETDSNAFLFFFFFAKYYSVVYMSYSFFIPSSVDGHLGCFHVLNTLNSAAVNTGILRAFS